MRLNNGYRIIMMTLLLKNVGFFLGIGLVLASCAAEPPYIFEADEFNREKAGFAKEITDRSIVEICYNKRSTTPKLLTQMAVDECRRFGKKAVFKEHKTLSCSVSAPAQAVFLCIGPDKKIAK